MTSRDQSSATSRGELRQQYLEHGWADADVNQFTRLVQVLGVQNTAPAGEQGVVWWFRGGVVVLMVMGHGPALWFVRLDGGSPPWVHR
jgi:hypothetical protein